MPKLGWRRTACNCWQSIGIMYVSLPSHLDSQSDMCRLGRRRAAPAAQQEAGLLRRADAISTTQVAEFIRLLRLQMLVRKP